MKWFTAFYKRFLSFLLKNIDEKIGTDFVINEIPKENLLYIKMESSAKSKDRVKKKDKEKPKDKFKKIILWIDDSPDIEKGKKKPW